MLKLFSRKTKEVDFQRDKLSSLLLRFSIPCIISLLVAASYNIVDQIFVGNSSLGVNGSSAVGIVFPLFIFAQAFSYLIGDGCSTYLAICQGKNDTSKAHKVIGAGITFTLILSIILAVIYIIWGVPLLRLFQASDSFIDQAYQYLKILSFFLPVFMLINLTSATIRADSFPRFQLISMVVGALLNVLLDFIFVPVCNFGIEGAAWATAIGQCATFGFVIYYLFHTKSYKFKKNSFIPTWSALKVSMRLGLSSSISQFSIVVVSLVSNIVLSKYGALSSFGADNAIAACLVETKVFTIIIDIVIGLSFGAQPIIGYNIGAGNLFKVKKTYRTILLISSIIGVIFTVLTLACPQVLFAPFGGMDNALYVQCVTDCFRLYMGTILLACISKVNIIFFQSCGKATQATIFSLFRDVILFVSALIFIPMIVEKNNPGYGVYGVFFAPILTDVIGFTISLILLMKVFQQLSLDYSNTDRIDCKILPSTPGPIIAISRQHGSQGKAVAKALAKKLNVPYYYKDIVFLAAKESGLSSTYIYHSFWNNKRSLISSSYITFNIDSMAFEAEEKVLNEVADQGSCVILERGASFYLKNRPNLINVFIYADEDVKLKNVMSKNAMTMKDAKHNIDKINRRRAKYYLNISNIPWGKKENYDLAIDSSDGNIERCVNEIVEYINKTGRN